MFGALMSVVSHLRLVSRLDAKQIMGNRSWCWPRITILRINTVTRRVVALCIAFLSTLFWGFIFIKYQDSRFEIEIEIQDGRYKVAIDESTRFIILSTFSSRWWIYRNWTDQVNFGEKLWNSLRCTFGHLQKTTTARGTESQHLRWNEVMERR